MPTSSPRPCRMAGCDQLVSRGYCRDHAKAVDKGYTRVGASLYRSAKWQGLRRRVLREAPWCETPGCPSLATEVDHVVAIRHGGAPLDRANLQSLCAMHHSAKTAAEVWGRKA